MKEVPEFFGIGSKPAVIKVRRKETVSEEEEIKDIIGSVKLDSFKTEKRKKKNPLKNLQKRWFLKKHQRKTHLPDTTEVKNLPEMKGSRKTTDLKDRRKKDIQRKNRKDL